MKKMLVYLDNCCYNRPYDDPSQIKVNIEAQAKVYIQKMITDKKLDLAYSYMSRYENSQNPFLIRREAISDFFKNAIVYVGEENSEIINEKAAKIMETGIKYKDAVHISCAIFAKADVFLSTDTRLLKFTTNEISLMNPLIFVNEMEEES